MSVSYVSQLCIALGLRAGAILSLTAPVRFRHWFTRRSNLNAKYSSRLLVPKSRSSKFWIRGLTVAVEGLGILNVAKNVIFGSFNGKPQATVFGNRISLRNAVACGSPLNEKA